LGYAIGLGNFWRFPYLMNTYGGSVFLIPYLLAMVFLGIPMVIMEITLGQYFQRGDIGVFKGIHPRLGGIGITSIWSGYAIQAYYVVIICWAMVYLGMSFVSPLKWSAEGQGEVSVGCSTQSPQYIFLYKDVIQSVDSECREYTTADDSFIVVPTLIALIVQYILIFLITMKGTKSAGFIVYLTVPMPVILILIMLIRGATLEGAGDGIIWYLSGFPGGPTVVEQLKNPSIWSDAVGQIFFSLGICMGVLTSLSSYNKKEKPILADAHILPILNSTVSLFAGFAVFTIIGYLRTKYPDQETKSSSFALAFEAYPTALLEIKGSNFRCFLLFLTLFSLGLDTAFTTVEAFSTVIYDYIFIKDVRKIRREFIAAGICITGFLCSLPFCLNTGLIWMNTVDHYVSNYLL